jgi:chemotaxis signal transduction protein
MKGYLLVRADGKTYGLPVARVLEVGDATEVLHIPRRLPAVRGLTPLRGRLVPLIHLGSFLTGSDAPPAPPPGAAASVRTVVLVELGAGGRQVAFEVDDADAVVREQPLPVPRGQTLPWAAGVAEQNGGLVPILDLDALGDRIA